MNSFKFFTCLTVRLIVLMSITAQIASCDSFPEITSATHQPPVQEDTFNNTLRQAVVQPLLVAFRPAQSPNPAHVSQKLGNLARSVLSNSTRRDLIGITLIIIVSLVLRLHGLDYNGPFIDESYYATGPHGVIPQFTTGDPHLWPALSLAAHRLGGLLGARALTSLFGTATAAVVYKTANLWLPGRTWRSLLKQPGLWAGLVYAVSASTLFVSRLATYDAMAYMFFAIGFWGLIQGIRRRSSSSLVTAAAFFTTAVASRYMLILFLPVVGIYALSHDSHRLKRFFLAPFGAMMTVYLWISRHYLWQAIQHAQQTGAGLTNTLGLMLAQDLSVIGFRGLGIYAQQNPEFAILLFIAVIAGPLFFIMWIRKISLSSKALDTNRISVNKFLWIASLWVIAYHVFMAGNIFSLEKNLAMTVYFGSFLAAQVFVRLSTDISGRWKKIFLPLILLVGLAMHGLVISRYLGQRWENWTPVAQSLRTLNLPGRTQIWAGGSSNIWQLRNEIGDSVDITSPWKAPSDEELLGMASQEGIPVLAIHWWERPLRVGETIGNYRVQGIIDVSTPWREAKPIYILYYKDFRPTKSAIQSSMVGRSQKEISSAA
jgi:4-amino-4-deoxy-L-arabinose transferase-like glycosyltransferase